MPGLRAAGQGRAVRNTDGTYRYEYNLTDHLGNVRVSIDKDPVTGQARVIQEDEYYAFGLNKPRVVVGDGNKYLYNGKEEQEAVLTDVYDYGARFYDPLIGRWNVMDPLQEDEYWNEFDNIYSNRMSSKEFESDVEQPETNTNSFFKFTEIYNIITAEIQLFTILRIRMRTLSTIL